MSSVNPLIFRLHDKAGKVQILRGKCSKIAGTCIAIKVVPKQFEFTDLKLWEIINTSHDYQTFTNRSACHFFILSIKTVLWLIKYETALSFNKKHL